MKKTYTQRVLALSAIAGAAALTATAAHAVDFDGYFRTGPGLTDKNQARGCYNLNVGDLGAGGGHYRLGNECNLYGEFGLAQTTNVDGVTVKTKVMFNEYNGGTDVGTSYSSFEQMYVEAKGFDVSPDTNFWIGKRFYGRADIHILDTFFVRMDGVGAGADNISALGGKLGVAYFSSDSSGGFGDGGNGASTNPSNRFNLDLTGVPVNPGGTLRVTATLTQGNYNASAPVTTYALNPQTGIINASTTAQGKGTSGFGISFQHNQDIKELGGGNTLWLQYANGSAGMDGNFGTAGARTSVKKWRLIETLNWQVGPFGGQALALYGQHDADTVNNTPKADDLSIGGRVSYGLTKNFKLVAEAGYMEYHPNGAPTQKLAKFTFAPTLSTGPDYWTRPELRVYMTTAKWNAPARGTIAGNGDPEALTKDTGTSFGFQVETWF